MYRPVDFIKAPLISNLLVFREVTGNGKFSGRETFQICTALLSVELNVVLTFSKVRCFTVPIKNKTGGRGEESCVRCCEWTNSRC